MNYAVITENDESVWDDETGVLYHFPKRYKKYLEPGTNLIYYKGRTRKKRFSAGRLSDFPHYFALAKIGKVYPDKGSKKGDLFATIVDFSPFKKPVLAKDESEYLEVIPEQKRSNYWRDGVRSIDQNTYKKIIALSELKSPSDVMLDHQVNDDLNDIEVSFESSFEGKASIRYYL